MDKPGINQTMDQFNEFVNLVILYGQDILLGMLILVIGLLAAKAVNKLLRRALAKFISNNALVSILSSIVFVLLLVFVMAGALQQAGLEGVVVRRIIFAITMAVVFLIIIFRPYLPKLPFKVGNFIKTGDLLGKVEATTLINTRIKTVDGKTVFVPNSIILKDYLTNYYSTPNRRVEVDVGTLGAQRISLGLLITSAGIIFGSFIASWILQKLLMDEVLTRRRVERGVRHSIGRLVHYLLIFIGFSLGLVTLGFDFTKLTIIFSALGIGIGFGLQSIVNNFISGLILLFERPVRVDDYIEFGGNWAEIKRIGLRSATVQTFDLADLIIPNADLVNNPVTNWTLSNRRVRLLIPVGVAYGSDVPLVMETLAACPKDHEMVAAFPAPQVLFLSFGESSLDFELRVWVKDADHRLVVKSELHQEIDRRFREANIEIAFPQRDLHLRSADDGAVLRHAQFKSS